MLKTETAVLSEELILTQEAFGHPKVTILIDTVATDSSVFPELAFLISLMTLSKVERVYSIEQGIRSWMRTARCKI
jgi:hypothetical protein